MTKGFKKVHDMVKYEYNSAKVTEEELDKFIESMRNKGYNLQDSYYLYSTSTMKELVFTKQ